MFLSIVIPSYNGLSLLKKSLPPLIASLAFAKIKQFEIIVVDNGSSPLTAGGTNFDNTKDLPEIKGIEVLSFPQPLGFAKATNIGIKKATGKYILLLNNDCLLKKNTIKNLVGFLEKNKEIYFTQPVIKEAGMETIGYRLYLKIAKAFPVNQNTNLSNFLKQENPFAKGWLYGLSATCMLTKKEVWQKAGLFDERFHSYLEDIDFCFRALKKNLMYSPCLAAKATHLHMQTSQKMGKYKARHDFINWIRIIYKHYPKKYVLRNFLTIFIERLKNLSGLIKKCQ